MKHLRENKNKLIAIASLLVVMIILSLLMRSQWIAEYIFARGISRFYALIIGFVSTLIPISLFEILIVISIVIGVIFFVKTIQRIKTRDWTKFVSGIVNLTFIVVTVLTVYTVTASMNYYRYPVELEIYNGNVSDDEIYDIAYHFLDDYNSIANNLERDSNGIIISPYTDRQMAKMMRGEFKRLDSNYYNSFVPLAKPILFKGIMSYNRINGVFFAPTAEPNINSGIPSYDKPYTMAHEIAHSLGVMREDEANFIATYITLTSDNEFFRYSGYINSFFNMTSLIYFSQGLEQYELFYSNIDLLIDNDIRHIWNYWGKYTSFMDSISNTINDIYLKFQGQKDGTGSYDNAFNYDAIDTGETNDQGDIIYEIEFSQVQKLYFQIYYNYNF